MNWYRWKVYWLSETNKETAADMEYPAKWYSPRSGVRLFLISPIASGRWCIQCKIISVNKFLAIQESSSKSAGYIIRQFQPCLSATSKWCWSCSRVALFLAEIMRSNLSSFMSLSRLFVNRFPELFFPLVANVSCSIRIILTPFEFNFSATGPARVVFLKTGAPWKITNTFYVHVVVAYSLSLLIVSRD